jgi:DNA-binding MarR family transcriptional regulator
MSEASSMVGQVRRFNRTVTERVGALNDHFLGLERPLGEARLLWEIGVDGCELRLLRSRLGLDSGYLSRLLRSLEAAGLVEVAASGRDRRIRVARLTAAGRVERAVLDERSDDLVERARAVAAVERGGGRWHGRLSLALAPGGPAGVREWTVHPPSKPVPRARPLLSTPARATP